MRSVSAAAWLLLVIFAATPCARAENYLILPFFNLSKDANLQWIGESLSASISDALGSEGVLTLPREDREEGYRRLSLRNDVQLTRATVMRIGESLDADQIIYGHYTFTPPAQPDAPRTKGTLKIVAQVVNLRKFSRGAEYTEIGSLEDLARLQIHLGWQTLKFVTPNAVPSEEDYRAKRPVIRVDALEAYIRGLLATTPDQRLKLFSQAVRLDPRYSQANFELARQYYARKSWKLAGDYFEKVAPEDSRRREARFYLGICRYRLDDFAAAQQAFRTVAEAVPLNEVWNNLGAAQARLNDPEALNSFRKAIEGDPNDPDYRFNAGYALYRQGDVDAAAGEFRAVLDRRPGDSEATTMLGRCLKRASSATQSRSAASSTTSEGMERLKESYEESAWRQLKAVLDPRRK